AASADAMRPTESLSPPSPVEIFGDIEPDAVVEAINKRIRRRSFAVPAGIAVSGALLAASMPWPVVAVAGVLSAVLVHLQHERARYSSLIYGNEEGTIERLEMLHKAVAALRSADS